jgi:outer membrane protein assembly factor BamB
MTKMTFAFATSLAAALAVQAADWPQYRGPNLDGSTAEKIATKWPAGGPKALWKVPALDGFSSFTVSGGQAFTLVMREVDGGPQEVCVALDASTGKEQWMAALGGLKLGDGGQAGAKGNDGGDGPRSTPTVSEGKVYVMSAKLVLSCFDAKTGKVAWQKDLVKDFAGRNISWQNAASPLVEGNLVYVAGGGAGQSSPSTSRPARSRGRHTMRKSPTPPPLPRPFMACGRSSSSARADSSPWTPRTASSSGSARSSSPFPRP